LAKLRAAIDAGADAVMDLSTGGDIPAVRRAIIAASERPIGTVPIYQAGIGAIEKHGAIVKMSADDIFEAIEDNARDGVDFVTVHCGVTQAAIARLKQQGCDLAPQAARSRGKRRSRRLGGAYCGHGPPGLGLEFIHAALECCSQNEKVRGHYTLFGLTDCNCVPYDLYTYSKRSSAQ